QMLRWARERDCPWDVETLCEAAAAGHIAVLDWAREQGCPSDTDDTSLCSAAASNGELECLKLLVANGYA
ncbi:MAG: ankyrin repeat domain-containing protein, partial [Myxococcota bacterium]